LSNENVTIVKLTSEQKSGISNFMRSRFAKVKFLRDNEWSQLEEKVLNPLLKFLHLEDSSEMIPVINAIKSNATKIINQKRAEVMRTLKQIAVSEYFKLFYNPMFSSQ